MKNIINLIVKDEDKEQRVDVFINKKEEFKKLNINQKINEKDFRDRGFGFVVSSLCCEN